MGILKQLYDSLFAKSYAAVWQQFAKENNGTYTEANNRVTYVYKTHVLVFDTHTHYTIVAGSTQEKEYTRARLEFVSPGNLQFRLMHQGIVDSIGKFFGAQDILIGDEKFDKRFMIKGNDESKVQLLFSNNALRNLLLTQQDLHLQLLDKEGIFDEPITEDHAMLYYLSTEKIKTIEQLNALYTLYTTLIDQLENLNAMKPLRAGH